MNKRVYVATLMDDPWWHSYTMLMPLLERLSET